MFDDVWTGKRANRSNNGWMRTFLSPKELARAVGVSESSIKRWADDDRLRVVRTAGGHRRIARQEAVRFVRDSHLSVVEPALLGLPDSVRDAAGLPPDAELPQRLYDLLYDGHLEAARGMILSSYMQGAAVARLCDQIVGPTMHRIGTIWEHRDEGVFIEHRATDTVIQALSELRLMLEEPAENAPIAIGGALSGDPYVLPTLMAAVVLSEAGFKVVNLGAETPVSALAHGVEQYAPGLVWLSLSVTAESPTPVLDEIVELARELESRSVPLVIGGRGVRSLRHPLPAGCVEMASMSELAAFSRGLISR